MGPFAAAYLAYKKGEVRSKQEMPAEVMLWILALGGAGIVVGLATYGYKIMNAMGVGLRRPPFAFVMTAAARWHDLDAPYLCPFAAMASTRRRERTPPTRIDPAGQAHRHYPLARHVHRAGRGLRHHLRDGPGLAALDDALPDRCDGGSWVVCCVEINQHRHAIEQASRRWRGCRREDSARTRHKF